MLTKRYTITATVSRAEIIGIVILAITCITALAIGQSWTTEPTARAALFLFQ